VRRPPSVDRGRAGVYTICMIPLRIHLFARARDLAGASSLDVLVEPGTTVGQLRERLHAEVPALGPILARCAIAVDQDFAGDDRPLPSGVAEVALIPPVSGGGDA